MGQNISRAYLTRQFAWVTVGLLVSLILTAYVGWHAVSQFHVRAEYDLAFSRLVAASERLQTELTLALFGLDPRGLGGGDHLEIAYIDLAHLYLDLTLVDRDGAPPSGMTSILAEISAAAGNDVSARILKEHRSSHLKGIHEAMPDSLSELWEEAGNDQSLEAVISDILQKAAKVVAAKGEYNSSDLGEIMKLLGNDFLLVRPYVDRLSDRLEEDRWRTAMVVRTLLFVMCAIGAGFSLTLWPFVFRPLTQAIVDAQAKVEAERDRAIKAEQAKASFLAVMSHELRTPMNAVIGFSTLLSQSKLQRAQKDYVDTILSSSETLLAVINDILDFSKIEAGKLEIEACDFSVEDVVSSIADVMGPGAYAKGVEIVSYVDPTLPRSVVGDPGRLRQVLFNLVGNAIKFTAHGSVSIEVHRLEKRDSDTEQFSISVIDTGIGIPEAAQKTIFDRFTQADASTTRKYGGTGLGLAISHRLIELMGGEISVTSKLGLGATFKVVLPLLQTEPPSVAIVETTPNCLEGRRFLVVDDNATNCRLISLILEGYGAVVASAGGGGEGVAALLEAKKAGHPFDGALIDHLMPQADGFDCIQMIRKLPAISDVVAVLSSSSQALRDDRWSQEGFDAAIPKPIRQSQLVRLLSDLLSKKTTRETHSSFSTTALECESRSEALSDDGELAVIPAEKPKRLLLADDNQANQRLIAAFLGRDAYSIDVASDGVEAVEMARKLPYDLILMDICMPGLGGVDATRRIRTAQSRNARTPIIAVTANVMKGDRETYLDAGMDDYITKPIKLEDLRKMLAKWSGARRDEGLDDANSIALGGPAA